MNQAIFEEILVEVDGIGGLRPDGPALRRIPRRGVPHVAGRERDEPRTKEVRGSNNAVLVEAKGLEPTNLLTASQALYQLSYAPEG